MSCSVNRTLSRLAAPRAILAPERSGEGYGLYLTGDRRRRPASRLSATDVRGLAAEGALVSEGDAYVLSPAGRARVLRGKANPGEQYLAQHVPVTSRPVMGESNDVRVVRGVDPDHALRKLGALRDADGKAWLEPAEMAAAARLRQDWLLGQIGLMRGSDWRVPPRSGGARGPGNGVEQLAGAQYDARRRVEIALDALAPPLRRTVEAVCLHEQGIETLEREQGWPARSGKIALKLGLAQLASQMR